MLILRRLLDIEIGGEIYAKRRKIEETESKQSKKPEAKEEQQDTKPEPESKSTKPTAKKEQPVKKKATGK